MLLLLLFIAFERLKIIVGLKKSKSDVVQCDFICMLILLISLFGLLLLVPVPYVWRFDAYGV